MRLLHTIVSIILLTVLAIAIIPEQPVSAATTYTMIDLSTLGGDRSSAWGINDDGIVVGRASVTSNDRHAILYLGGRLADLGTFGGPNSNALGINATGQIAGWANIDQTNFHAFLYSNGKLNDLGTLGGASSEAFAINNSTQIVGDSRTGANDLHAFLYSSGKLNDLGTLGGKTSVARGINDAGLIAGWSLTAEGYSHAFLYRDGKMTDLGTFGSPQLSSVANKINNAGMIVGASEIVSGTQHAFLHNGSKLIDLGTLGGGTSEALGINNAGVIVGVSTLSNKEEHAFIYRNNKMTDLNSLLPANSGWVLSQANDINSAGEIVGVGSIHGLTHAFLMIPPAPIDKRYFAATGYRIDNDAIWNYFQLRGGSITFGYPTSNSFRLLGFTVQIFQRHVLQVAQDGSVHPLNLLDPDLLPLARLNFSTFPGHDPAIANAAPKPGSTNYGPAVLQYLQSSVPDQWDGQPVKFLQSYLSAGSASSGNLRPLLALEVWGFPTSHPARDPNNPNFIYLRFQRGILHYDAATKVTRGILLADALKSVLTGQGPADLLDQMQMQGSRFYQQYCPAQPGWVCRAQDLPNTDLTTAFTRR